MYKLSTPVSEIFPLYYIQMEEFSHYKRKLLCRALYCRSIQFTFLLYYIEYVS